MSTRLFGLVLATILLATVHSAQAQQTQKVPRIGYLLEITPSGSAMLLNAFRQGLRDLGYIEGKNFVIEPRWARIWTSCRPWRLSWFSSKFERHRDGVNPAHSRGKESY